MIEENEGTMTVDKIKTAGDVRKVFGDVVDEVRKQGKTTADLAEQIPAMRKDLETALAAQKQIAELGRPQPTGFGHVRVPSEMNTPRKMVGWAGRLRPERYDGQAGQSIKYFQECSDVLALQYNVAKHIVAKGGSEERDWFNEKVMQGEVMQEYIGAAENLFAKNINTENTGEGLEWTPDEIKSTQFIDRIRDASFYAGLYVQITMQGAKFTLPANGGDIGVFLVSQLTGGLPASAAITTGEDKMVSREVVFDASKMGVRSGWSRESVEDMTVQAGGIITGNMAQAMADQIDSNVLFGDSDGTFHTLTPAASAVGGAARMWDGIIKAASVANRDASGAGATLGWQLMGDQLGRMGQAAGSRFSKSNTGANGAIFHVTWKSFFDLVKEEDSTYGPSPIVTLDKYGPAATIIDGEAARIFGRPIIPTEMMRDDLLAASGAWATTGATAACVCSNVGQWGLGTRRGMELRVSTELYMESDAIVAVTFYRGDFQPLQLLANSGIADLLYNIV